VAGKTKRKPILVPVDFSSYSEAALLKACELADCLRAPIIVLHVVHDPGEMPSYYSQITKKKNLLRIEDIAAEMFADYIKAVKKKNPGHKGLKKIKTMLVKGLPVTRILQVADKTEAAMVVMGSLGRTGLSHVLLGSKAEQVVRLCPVPVTIVKSQESRG